MVFFFFGGGGGGARPPPPPPPDISAFYTCTATHMQRLHFERGTCEPRSKYFAYILIIIHMLARARGKFRQIATKIYMRADTLKAGYR